jgi:hypothetical protein
LKRGRTEKPPDENASKKGFFNWFKSDPKPEAKPEAKPQIGALRMPRPHLPF